MRRVLPLGLLLGACAHDGGGWPSLAPRASETRVAAADDPAGPVPGTSGASETSGNRSTNVAVAGSPADDGTVAVPLVRIDGGDAARAAARALPEAEAALRWPALHARVPPVEAALARTLAAAAHARPGDDRWAAAQVELSRAEQLLGAIDALGTAERSDAPADTATPTGQDATPYPPAAAARAELAQRIDAAKAALAR